MTNNYDAGIARAWAEGFIKHADSAQIVDASALTAARHTLATTPPPTMADVEWDNDVHAGWCAEHPLYGEVRMIWEDAGDILFLYVEEGQLCYRWTDPANLTPIPGTKIDLTPRRESEPTPDHPTRLTTVAEYLDAPAGTVVAAEGEEAWTKNKDGYWETHDITRGYSSYLMAEDGARCVLRWGDVS